MDLPDTTGVTAIPTTSSLGADVIGVDLSKPIDGVTFDAIEAAWHQHLVLRFRGQQLDDPGLLRFARMFGELDKAPIHAKKEVEDPFPAVPRPPPQRLHHGIAVSRERRSARQAMGACIPAALRVVSAVESRRLADLGQSLRDAPQGCI